MDVVSYGKLVEDVATANGISNQTAEQFIAKAFYTIATEGDIEMVWKALAKAL